MIVGHEDRIKSFKKLIDTNKLAHGYIFFGERSIGKFLFASALANYLENHVFEPSQKFLNETLIIKSELKKSGKTISINTAREVKRFLAQKPVFGQKRIVIIDEAETLTSQAQNAILKISEEPPEHSLIILIAPHTENIIPALASRLQRIYFPRIKPNIIQNFLSEKYKEKETAAITKLVRGQIGRAVEMMENEEYKELNKYAKKFIQEVRSRDAIIKEIDKTGETDLFIEILLAELSTEKEKNFGMIAALIKRIRVLEEFNTNKRLQIESALLWNI